MASAAKHCRFELRRTKLVATEVWHTKHFAMFFWGGVEFAPIFPTRKSGRKHVFHLFCRYVFFMIRIHLYLARWQALPSIADCCAVCLQFIARLALLGLWATGVARCLRSWAACASYMFSITCPARVCGSKCCHKNGWQKAPGMEKRMHGSAWLMLGL